MRRLFFTMARSSSAEAKNRLNAVIKRDRQTLLQTNKTEKIRKEVMAILGKYTAENAPVPVVTASLKGGNCTLSAVVSLN